MARRCMLTGKGPRSVNNVSHANSKTKRRQRPNLQWKRIYVPELDRVVRIRLSTRALRTIDKKGLMRFLRDHEMTLKDIT